MDFSMMPEKAILSGFRLGFDKFWLILISGIGFGNMI